MTKMVKCKVLPGHRYGYIDRSDGKSKRVLAEPGDVITISAVAAKRFPHAVMPIAQAIKEEQRQIDVEKANKELAGMTTEQIEEEAAEAKTAKSKSKSSK